MAAGRNSSKDVRATTLLTAIPNPCQWDFAYLCLLNPAHSCPNGERQRSALQNVLKAPISCLTMIHEMKPCEVSQTRRALQNLSSELTRSWWVDALWVLVSSDGASPEPPIATHKNYSHSIRYCGYSTARADLQATVGGSQSHPRARATKWLTPRTSGRLCVWATTKWRLIHCPRQDGSSVSILPSIASAAVAAARDASCQLLRTCQQTTKLFWCKMQNGCSEPSYIWFGQFRSDFTASSEMGKLLIFFFGGGAGRSIKSDRWRAFDHLGGLVQILVEIDPLKIYYHIWNGNFYHEKCERFSGEEELADAKEVQAAAEVGFQHGVLHALGRKPKRLGWNHSSWYFNLIVLVLMSWCQWKALMKELFSPSGANQEAKNRIDCQLRDFTFDILWLSRRSHEIWQNLLSFQPGRSQKNFKSQTSWGQTCGPQQKNT